MTPGAGSAVADGGGAAGAMAGGVAMATAAVGRTTDCGGGYGTRY